jgi:hypothetical protein
LTQTHPKTKGLFHFRRKLKLFRMAFDAAPCFVDVSDDDLQFDIDLPFPSLASNSNNNISPPDVVIDEVKERDDVEWKLGISPLENLARVFVVHNGDASKTKVINGVRFASATCVDHRTFYLFTREGKRAKAATWIDLVHGEFFLERWSVKATLIPMSEDRIGKRAFLLLNKSR